MDKLKMHTPSLTEANFAALAALFPNAVTETIDENGAVVRAIDKDVLTQEINVHVIEGREERYQFTWPDKRKSVLLANAPIAAALRPCREESVDFGNTENLYIEGDNLDVLKLLRETYLNRVKMIYIDPPYNTGNDFVYEDDFSESAAEYAERSGDYDEQGNRLVKNLDSNGRFHTDWLNMIYPRLRVARDLLTEDGVIFISIDDNEVENLKKVCNEVFGSGNFVTCIEWQKRYTRSNNTDGFTNVTEHIIVYSKNEFMPNLMARTEEADARYSNPDNDSRGAWKAMPFSSQASPQQRPNLCYEITNPFTGEVITPKQKAWRSSKEVFEQYVRDDVVWWGKEGNATVPSIKRFLSEAREGMTPINFWDYEFAGNTDDANREVKELFTSKVFDTPKPVLLLKRMLEIATKSGDIILDFFSGSATTAHAVMQLNAEDGSKRKFIMVQLPEVCDEKSEAAKAGYKNICEIGKERIRRAGAKILGELTAKNAKKDESDSFSRFSCGSRLDTGFRVLKLDSTNMKDVYYTPDEYAQINFSFDGLADNIKEDRTGEDLLFQVMLDLGIPLSAKITQDGDVYYVNDNYLIACFKRVDTNLITEIAKQKPYYAVFRDSSFVSDSALVNFEQVFNTYSPNTIRKVL